MAAARSRWWWRALAGVAVLLSAVGAAAIWGPGIGGGVRYVAVPTVVLPMPPLPAPLPPAAVPAPESAAGSPPVPTPPPLARLGAAEPSGLADLPPPDPCARRACVAVAVTGLGLAAEPSRRALALPAAVGLSFSPYAGDLAKWAERARTGGHEVLLDLPLQPERYPEDDAGPLTLLVEEPAWEREETLADLLEGRDGWLGVVAGAGAFAAEPERFAPIAAALAARGLALVEVAGGGLGRVARAGGTALAYARAERPADRPAEVGAAGIDGTLAAAEGEARRAGRALVALPLMPVAVDRLGAWIGGLGEKGIALVPVSAVLARAPERRQEEARRP